MTPEGEKLDRFLDEAIQQLGGQTKMPEIGSKSAVSSLREARDAIRRASVEVAGALTDRAKAMAEEIKNNGQLVGHKMEEEHAETMQIFNEFLGNERAEDGKTD